MQVLGLHLAWGTCLLRGLFAALNTLVDDGGTSDSFTTERSPLGAPSVSDLRRRGVSLLAQPRSGDIFFSRRRRAGDGAAGLRAGYRKHAGDGQRSAGTASAASLLRRPVPSRGCSSRCGNAGRLRCAVVGLGVSPAGCIPIRDAASWRQRPSPRSSNRTRALYAGCERPSASGTTPLGGRDRGRVAFNAAAGVSAPTTQVSGGRECRCRADRLRPAAR